jgi:16S rRNA (uracil1498-N3)-methyltransferase
VSAPVKKPANEPVSDRHEFALYTQDLPHMPVVGRLVAFDDQALMHRLMHVLRVRSDDTVLFFDSQQVIQASITKLDKKILQVHVLQVTPVAPLVPAIHWILPVLEKTALEEALYALSAMGAATITLVVTDKCHKQVLAPAYCERLNRILIAACEQAKQFVLPRLVLPEKQGAGRPSSLSRALASASKPLLFFDCEATPAFQVMQRLVLEKPASLTCFVGPEGDFTREERELIAAHAPYTCALTPTVLTAWHAVIVGMGLARSCVN